MHHLVFRDPAQLLKADIPAAHGKGFAQDLPLSKLVRNGGGL